jgi:hypothetical protein
MGLKPQVHASHQPTNAHFSQNDHDNQDKKPLHRLEVDIMKNDQRKQADQNTANHFSSIKPSLINSELLSQADLHAPKHDFSFDCTRS